MKMKHFLICIVGALSMGLASMSYAQWSRAPSNGEVIASGSHEEECIKQQEECIEPPLKGAYEIYKEGVVMIGVDTEVPDYPDNTYYYPTLPRGSAGSKKMETVREILTRKLSNAKESLIKDINILREAMGPGILDSDSEKNLQIMRLKIQLITKAMEKLSQVSLPSKRASASPRRLAPPPVPRMVAPRPVHPKK